MISLSLFINLFKMIWKIRTHFIYVLGIIGFLSCNNSKPVASSDLGKDERDKGAKYFPNINSLSDPLQNIKILSRNVLLVEPSRAMQSFGFDKNDNIYYSQIGGSGKDAEGNSKGNDIVYIARGRVNSYIADDFMTLQYFGHAANIAVEDTKEGSYIWVSSNASRHTTGDRLESGNYWSERSVSRIKYEKGKAYQGYGGETFFLNRGDFYVQLAAIDETNKYMCFVACTKEEKGLTRNFYTFKLNDVKNAPLNDFEFSVRIGGNDEDNPEGIVTRKVKGRDLGNLKPLGSFSIVPGKNWATDINTYPTQGVEIDKHGQIYFYEGVCASAERPQGAYVTVFDWHGKVVGQRTAVNAIADSSALFQAGLTNRNGCMEAEGIKIIGNKLYLGFAAKLQSDVPKKNIKSANIFEYQVKD